MGAGYSHYYIRVYDKDNKPDLDMAKQIFDYCVENYDWFSKAVSDEILVLRDHEIVTENEWDTEHSSDRETIENLEWMNDVYEALEPAQMFVNLDVDYGATSLDMYTEYTGKVGTNWDGNYGFYFYSKDYFQGSDFWGEKDSGWCYYYCLEPGDNVMLCFRHKETGELVLEEYVKVVPAECECCDDVEDADLFSSCCEENYKLVVGCGNFFTLLDENDEPIKYPSDFDHVKNIDELKAEYDFVDSEGDCRDPDDFEFVGLGHLQKIDDCHEEIKIIKEVNPNYSDED